MSAFIEYVRRSRPGPKKLLISEAVKLMAYTLQAIISSTHTYSWSRLRLMQKVSECRYIDN